MTRFTTETGSVYELDPDQKRIRRLSGANDPTPRQGADGDWRSYHGLLPEVPEVGERLYVIWHVDETDDGPVNRGTLTSRVTAVAS